MEDWPKLINTNDDSVVSITSPSFSIGRSLSCDHIIQSLGVSRFHCVIKKNENKWTIYDRSSNGTMVNSTLHKFNDFVDLNDGDVIKLGPENLNFIFRLSKKSDTQSSDDTVVLDNDAVLLEEFQQPFEEEADKKNQPEDDIMENELTCSICSELFIKAVTLNCSHTYCKYCIDQWKKSKKNCPICRKHITSVAPTLVLDNFIEKFISTQSDKVKETRNVLVKQRQEIMGNVASSSHSKPEEVVRISSDEEDSDYSDYDEDEDEDYDYGTYEWYFSNRDRRAYYGGYGRCYVCNGEGHWANSCPMRRSHE